MKRKSLLFLLLFALIAPWAANAQTLTVCNGTENNEYVPFYGYYADESQHNQMIFPATDLTAMNGMAITQMVFYIDPDAANGSYTAASRLGTWTVSLGETTATTLSGLDNATTLTQVYQGYFDCSTGTLTLPFDNEYAYHGGNLLVDLTHAAASWNHWFFLGVTATGASYCYNAQRNFLPKTTFSYVVPATCAKPTNLTANLVDGDGSKAILNWTENGSATQWQVCLDGDMTNLIPANTNVNFELTGLTAEVNHTVKVRAYCDANDQSDWSNEVTFKPTNAFSLLVNDGTVTNGYVPIYGFYVDDITKSQFIIPAADLADLENGTITKMTFFGSMTGSYDNWGSATFEVYMTETTETTVSALVDYTTMQKVMNAASLRIVDGEMVVEFDTPFEYFGGNLMIGFLQTVSGQYSSCSWLGVTTTGASMGGYGSSINQQNFLPKINFSYLPGEAPTCPKPRGLVAGTPAARSVVLNWTENGEARDWQICLNGDETNLIPANTNEDFLLEGLTPDTDYTIKVRSYCSEDDQSDWSNEVTIHTDVTCPAPTNLTVSGLTPFAANVAWDGTASNFNMRYKEIDASQYAIVTLRTDDVWSDGTGYQLLLDADATAYGTIIPETGGLTSSGDASAETYAEFEYKIPLNADGAMTTTNMVMNSSVSILIPAGTYDWCITNPTPDDRIWIAATAGTAGGRQDDYVFEAGKAYEFYVTLDEQTGNDNTDVTIVDFIGTDEGWSTPVAATSPLAFTELNPATGYAVEIQAACGDEDGESAWVPVYFVTPSNCDAPFDLNVTDLKAQSATLNWTGYQDGFQVRYRTVASEEKYFFENFENLEDNALPTGWTTIDADGDGYAWYSLSGEDWAQYSHSGQGLVTSASYQGSALTPDNWLITPQIELKGTMKVWMRAQDPSWSAEHYAIYLSTTGNEVANFTTTLVAESYDLTGDYIEVSADLSSYNGAMGYIAIRHFNCTDQFRLNVDDFGIYGDEIPAGEWQYGTTDALFFNTNDNPDYPLIPDTDYEWQVRGENRDCGDEGYTEWSEMAYFHTESACGLPTNLETTDIEANAATLTWDGVQEDYNVRYRTAGFDGYYLKEDFEGETVLEGWSYYNWDDDYTGLYWEDAAHTNTILMMVAAGGTTGQYLFSPDFRAEAAGNTLTFNYAALNDTVTESFSVGFVTDSVVWDDITTNDTLWQTYTKVVPEGAQYMIIYYEDGYALQLDNFLCYNADDIVAAGEWIETLEGVNSPVAIEGLDPETYYEWEVQGNSELCGDGATDWVTAPEFKTLESEGQTIALVAGTNWFSTYFDIPLADLQHALNEALPSATSMTIKSKNSTSRWNGSQWRNANGFVWDVAKMYMIVVPEDCELVLNGTLINPAEHTINIEAGTPTWIGFPFSESKTFSEAIPAGFAVNGDQIKYQNATARFNGTNWRGSAGFTGLEPGKGYMYVPASNVTTDRTLDYSLGTSKAAKTSNLNFKKEAINRSLTPKMMPKAFNSKSNVQAEQKVTCKKAKKNEDCKSIKK